MVVPSDTSYFQDLISALFFTRPASLTNLLRLIEWPLTWNIRSSTRRHNLASSAETTGWLVSLTFYVTTCIQCTNTVEILMRGSRVVLHVHTAPLIESTAWRK